MLQRLFSRGVSRDRIEDAIEHSSEAEQRDALRERSAMILQRLENKRLEARRAELAHRRAELEAAEEAEREAAEFTSADEIVETAPEAEEGDAGLAEAAAPADPSDAPAAMDSLEEPQAEEHDHDETLEFAEGPFREIHPEAHRDAIEDEAEEEVAEAAEAETVEFRPMEEPEGAAEVIEDPEPFANAEVEDASASFEEPEAAELSPSAEEVEAEAENPVSGPRSNEDLFAESEPLRPAAEINLPFSVSHDNGDVPAAETQHSALADQDPEAYEQLLRKAEEAKARIAKRLETLKAEEEASAAASLLDIGAAAPPLAPDHGDEDD